MWVQCTAPQKHGITVSKISAQDAVWPVVCHISLGSGPSLLQKDTCNRCSADTNMAAATFFTQWLDNVINILTENGCIGMGTIFL